MNPIIYLIYAGGLAHLILVAANIAIPRILDYRGNLKKLPPLLRQIFIVHSIYIAFVLLLFAGLSFFFASDLAGKTSLGRILSGFIALFWFVRIPIQLFYYDADTKRKYPLGNFAMLLALLFLTAVYSIAALGGGR